AIPNYAQQNFPKEKSSDTLTAVEQVEVPNAKKVEVDFYGFIRHDAFFDTRQVIGAGENLVPLYPRDKVYDENGEDINAASQFHMLSVLSRAGIKLKGPDVLDAKLNGVLEGEFFGSSEAGINQFRLRHAYITLDWEKTQLGIGQFWHPMVVLECLPNVVNYSTGSPIFPLNRNPQIRVTQKLGSKFKAMAAAISQRDFTPDNTAYRNAGIPSMHLQLQYKSEKFVAGIAQQYENLRPQIVSGENMLASNERVESFTTMAYASLKTKPLKISSAVIFAQNAASLVMLGGYVGYSRPEQVDVFKPMNTRSAWIDFQQMTNKKIALGLFAGAVKNEGVSDPIEGAVAMTYGVTSAWRAVSATEGSRTINHLYRVVPRIDFNLNKSFKFRFEVEHTTAEWADAQIDATGVCNEISATNYRFHLATFFTF
ncbi:DcaP family trimeric outer membrane transporter, partial [Mesonia sp.]|uniref:DcaP family trimeric outer membrane transporter n=1 Tax=Mesonia sp. TaxID=1960830 RepID=UPI0034234529